MSNSTIKISCDTPEIEEFTIFCEKLGYQIDSDSTENSEIVYELWEKYCNC